MDLLQREGAYPVPAHAPTTLGVEFSGTITSLGASESSSNTSPVTAHDFSVGDSVFGLAYGGAYAEYIAVSIDMLVHKPTHLTWVEAAGVPETWITATQALLLIGGFKRGQRVLWHAGASGVSIAGIQLSRAEGASAIYVTAGSQQKIDFCVKEVGATRGWNYRDEGQDWSRAVVEATGGEGVNVIVDFVGAGYFAANLRAAARDGTIVNLGLMGGSKLEAGTDIAAFVLKRLRFEGSSLRSRDLTYQRKLRDMLVEHAMPRFETGEFKVWVDKVFTMEEVVEAHQYMESNRSMGKIICTVNR